MAETANLIYVSGPKTEERKKLLDDMAEHGLHILWRTKKDNNVVFNASGILSRKETAVISDPVPSRGMREAILKKIKKRFEADKKRPAGLTLRSTLMIVMGTMDEKNLKYAGNFEVPYYSEGWDEIMLIWPDNPADVLTPGSDEALGFMTDGVSLKEHLEESKRNVRQMAEVSGKNADWQALEDAAYWHDIGKLYAVREEGPDGNVSYRDHSRLSAYAYLCYMNMQGHGMRISNVNVPELLSDADITDNDKEHRRILHTALLIERLHMAETVWERKPKTKNKDIGRFGEAVVKELEILQDACRAHE